MPNYSRNELIIYGSSDELKYFYERNRVSEEDAKYMEDTSVCELSFEKCVPRSITKVMVHFMKEKYNVKSNDWDVMCAIWGTKWDAWDSMVNLDEINNENNSHIKYLFNTAWSYPENWLITISQIFPKLTFKIKHSNECDGYDKTHIDQFNNGVKTNIETYSAVLRCIEENGGAENIVNMIIEFFQNDGIWITYCKTYLKKNKDNDCNNQLFYELTQLIDGFLYEKELHPSLYTNNELCNLFANKVKNM